MRDRKTQERIKKLIKRIIDDPEIGKPLRYELKGFRSLRIAPFRMIYEYKLDLIIFHKFEIRKKAYRV